MEQARNEVLDWLRDAHAMEQQAEQMLSATAERVEHYPELQARLRSHLEETRGQARRLRAYLEAHGGDTSLVKDVTGRVAAFAQGVGTMAAGDEVVKIALASYHFEQLEIASYRILLAAAELLQDEDLRAVSAGNLAEEEAMAAWLLEQLPSITRQYLQRSETGGLPAKR
ncbi:ferritin-like domain-containing protein [Xylophilus sp.]|uniref:ferritin-like domain-containing protein n=1 Tax=Xylophilus sp. TaxID=2653893 RepID=UPI0013B74622|nr:ferritin-like domain-containing protein [Xylophilus sp.]KAF1050231.1 MAG: Protein YciE [Xylophilus sp.]